MPAGLGKGVAPSVKAMSGNQQPIGSGGEVGKGGMTEFPHVLTVGQDWNRNRRSVGANPFQTFQHFQPYKPQMTQQRG